MRPPLSTFVGDGQRDRAEQMKRPRHASKAAYHPQAFGGWGDYQTWADNDFLPKPAEQAEPDEPAEEQAGSPAEPSGGDAGGASGEDSADSPDFDSPDFGSPDFGSPGGEFAAAAYLDPPTLPEAPVAADALASWGESEHVPKARPYVRTGGRTRAAHDLRLETLLSADGFAAPTADPTRRALGELCRTPVSVAEIAARLGVPLGVARVLISDAITAQYLLVHEPAISRDGEPPMDLLHRVISGLRNLR
jgi:hypothetical protein